LDDGIFTITFLQSFKDDFVSVTVNRQVENPASPLEAYDITANDFKINRENNISGWGLCNWMAIGPAE